MDDQSLLKIDELVFTVRLIYETIHFDEPIDKTAEKMFRNLGLQNGAIENFQRMMWIHHREMLQRVNEGHEPPTVHSNPWESQSIFLTRVTEVQEWLRQNGIEPAAVETFIRESK